MSFKEKSVLGSLILTVIVFSYYFIKVFRITETSVLDIATGTFYFIGAVVLMVLLDIILHIVLTISNKHESNQINDERDTLIELKATRISYYVLVFGIFSVGISLIFSYNPLFLVNLILLFFVIAEIVGFSMQLYFYRKGV